MVVRFLTSVAAFVLLIASDAFGQQQAIRKDGSTTHGRLLGDDPQQLQFRAVSGDQLSLSAIRKIRFGNTGSPFTAVPTRRIVLRGGDAIAGGIIGWDQQSLRCSLAGLQVNVPRSELSSIERIEGWRDVLFESFEGTPALWKEAVSSTRTEHGSSATVNPSAEAAHRLAEPIREGFLSLRYLGGAGGDWGVRLEFAEDTHTESVQVSLRDLRVAAKGVAVQRLQTKADENRLLVEFSRDSIRLSVNGDLLATGKGRGSLHAVGVYRTKAEMQSPGWLDDFWLVEKVSVTSNPSIRATASQDAVRLQTGDVLFGEVRRMGNASVVLKGEFGEIELPWSQVVGVSFQDVTDHKPVSSEGWHAVIELNDLSSRFRMTAAIQSADEKLLTVAHPVMGKLALPHRFIQSVTPMFYGVRRRLAVNRVHLGNNLQATFRQPRPRGTTITGRFPATKQGGDFCISVHGLEPSGPKTPLGSKFLSELRAGNLVTRLVVNGEVVDDLNRHFDRRFDSPHKIRVPVPARYLRQGDNSWEIRQRPLSDDLAEFDDCEIGPVWWNAAGADLRPRLTK